MSVDHDSIKANNLLVEGKGLHDAGKYEEAIASYDKAIEIKSEFVDVWNGKGDALQKLERYDDAIVCYDKAIEIDPKNVESLYEKGEALQKLGRYDDAIASYDEVIKIGDKLNVGAWNGKGEALQKLERYEDAIACYDKAENSYAWSHKADALQKLERYDDAIACYDKIIEKKPKDGLAWRNKGTVLQKLERYNDALACYDKVIEMYPGDTITWDNKRIASAKLGEKLGDEYDPRCTNCDHYPWTDVFVSGRGWDEHESRFGLGSSTFNERYECKCKCHDAPTYGKIMRFSLKRKDAETSRHVMYTVKLAVCPFCKRSEFEDSVFNKINDDNIVERHGSRYDNDYNDLYEPGKHNSNETLLTPCAENHKHEWYECACGRKVCKISFRNYFGYEISDELFDNDFVDRSHYSERTKALLDEDKHGYGDKYPPFEPKSAEVQIYATMATIEKVWGKLPRYRSRKKWGSAFFHDSSDFPAPENDREETRPSPWKIRDISMSEDILSSEYMYNYFLEVKKAHEERLEEQFLDEVYGIGYETVEKLFKKFRNADKVFSATAEEIAKAPGISEGRAKQIRKKLDVHDKEYGHEYRDKKRKEPFTYSDPRNPSYTYRSESFESTEGKKGD